VERCATYLGQAEIAGGIGQQPADQELQRQVIDPLMTLAARAARRGEPSIDNAVAQGQRGGGIPVVDRSMRRILADGVAQLVDDGLFEVGDLAGTSSVFDEQGLKLLCASEVGAGHSPWSGKHPGPIANLIHYELINSKSALWQGPAGTFTGSRSLVCTIASMEWVRS
jgi:hypothetical protein